MKQLPNKYEVERKKENTFIFHAIFDRWNSRKDEKVYK